MQTKSNLLYFIVGVLVVVVAGMGYYIYQQKQQENQVELKIGNQRVSIEKK